MDSGLHHRRERRNWRSSRGEVTDILTTSYDAFIMGQRPVSEWTQVQDQIRESAERICEIYNTAAAR